MMRTKWDIIDAIDYSAHRYTLFEKDFTEERWAKGLTHKYQKMINYSKRINNNAENIYHYFTYKQLMELYNLVKVYFDNYTFKYGDPYITMDYDEFGKSKYVVFVIPDCNWEEWDEVEKTMYHSMNLLKGDLVIICLKGLTQ